MTDRTISLNLVLSHEAADALREIKETYRVTSDAEAIRIALGTERRMAEAFRMNDHIIVADANKYTKELVFSHWRRARCRKGEDA